MTKKCSICDDPDSKGNPIISCAVCHVQVHVYCYGINTSNSIKHWKCSPCTLGAIKFAKCQLCLTKNGALKRSKSGKWVHVICALFTEGTIFCDKNSMEPIDISKLSIVDRNKQCIFCLSSKGFTSVCSEKKCNNRFHIMCAHNDKCLEEIVNSENDSIEFRANCENHKPKDSARRLSSESIRDAPKKKKHDKLLKTAANRMDAEWIKSKNDIVPVSGNKENEPPRKVAKLMNERWEALITVTKGK